MITAWKFWNPWALGIIDLNTPNDEWRKYFTTKFRKIIVEGEYSHKCWAGAGDTSFFDTDFDTETLPMSGRFRYWYRYQEKYQFRFRFRYWYQSQTSFITKILMKCPKSLSGVPDFSDYRFRYWYWYWKFPKIDTDTDTRLSSIAIPDRFR